MRRAPLGLLLLLVALAPIGGALTACFCQREARQVVQGVGATFPAPLYQNWFLEYHRLHPEVRVNYQALGSGAGKQQFTKHLVDFGASDAAMTDEEMAKVPGGVLLAPVTAGAVALAYNLPGITTAVRLPRPVYADIFLGKITHWNDDRIIAANPDIELPHLRITVVRRADGSGTTFVFTQHLSAINDEWRRSVGTGTTVQWPTGIGGKGNQGVAALIQQNRGAIGYLEFGYAEASGLAMASLENRAGVFVVPSLASGQAALEGVPLPENLRAWVPDPAGREAYPIVTYTWLLLYRKYEQPDMAATIKDLVRYALTDGQAVSAQLGYIPLPASVTRFVLAAVDQIEG